MIKETFKPWLAATRPKTLPAAAAPVLVGTACAWSAAGFRLIPALAAFLGALLLQIGVNLANDYFDFVKGVDTEERLGPQRATASGLISLQSMRIGITVVIALAVLDGIYLFTIGGFPIIVIGILSILSLLAYSGGPFPLASHGLGDLFVFIFFGLVAVGGTFYVQTLTLTAFALAASLPSAMQITAILIVNNYRDRDTDKKSGKNTLAVKLGEKGSRVEYILLLLIPYVIPLILFFTKLEGIFILLPLFSLPLCVPLIKQINGAYTGVQLNKTLAGTAKLSLIFSVLFSAGLVIG